MENNQGGCSGGSRRRSKGKGKGKNKKGGCWGGNNTMRGGNFVGFQGGLDGTTLPQWGAVSNDAVDHNGGVIENPTQETKLSGGRRKTKRMTMKNIKKMLKKNGLKTTGRKSVLLRRMKKAKIMKGGADYLPLKAAVSGFTGEGAVRGMGGFQDVGGQRPNGVVELK